MTKDPVGGLSLREGIFTSDTPHSESLYLSQRQPTKKSGAKSRFYEPLSDYAGLFRNFAEIEPTAEGTMRFAEKFGPLGFGGLVMTADAKGAASFTNLGEPLGWWIREIIAMRRAVSAWDALQVEDSEAVRQFLRWIGTDAIECLWADDPKERNRFVEITIKAIPDLSDQFRPDDLMQAGRQYLGRLIDSRVANRTSTRFLRSQDSSTFEFVLVPVSLIGALWFQLANAVAGEKQYRQCPVCRTWFEVSAPATRITRVFCTNACRFKNYRDRQEQARQLYATGKNFRQVSRELETDVATVKRWVALGAAAGSKSSTRPKTNKKQL